jgi:Zn2+/Cd2+-exporting ATPase
MKKYQLKNLDCASCATKIEDVVRKMGDVKFVSVNFATSSITLDTDNLDNVRQKIKEIEPDVDVEEQGIKKAQIWASEIAEHKVAIFKAVIGALLLLLGLIFREEIRNTPYGVLEYFVFGTAYLIVGWKVLAMAIRNIARGRVFNEFFLMSVATLGAFAINELPEAVAVMLFYVVGELFQDISVARSRKSIHSLLEIKPDYANLAAGSEVIRVSPENVKVGDTIIVKAGEKIPLDGEIIQGASFVDTSALTGESVPRRVENNDAVLAGMINQTGLLTIQVTKPFSESSISKILELVENASTKKAETERFITTFAKYYTPVVVFAALLLAILPPLLISGQMFGDWIYRALVVLVVSCPCALVISIPLGYFGGVGAASRKGILVKGSNFLDALTHVNIVVFDKTGTLTKGEFKVSEIITYNGFSKDEVLKYAAYAESRSNHPIAKSILSAFAAPLNNGIERVDEISGHGIMAIVDGKSILAGNDNLLHRENIDHPVCDVEGTVVHVAIDKIYAGYIIIADHLKDDAVEAVKTLKERHIKTIMLTGDNRFAAEGIAKKLNIDGYYAELLPEDKVRHIERLIEENKGGKVAFVGDGINDAPVLARADVGIAMGALGSDAAIETADVVLMTDSPAKVAVAIDIAKKTRSIVWQNIFFALGVKMFFIVMGVLGVATMWEAVFGDMGVALIAVFNAMRVMKG